VLVNGEQRYIRVIYWVKCALIVRPPTAKIRKSRPMRFSPKKRIGL
jgi:hypothetical protein